MKDEFIYYEVCWFLEDSKLIKRRKFYDKKLAFEWYELLPEKNRYEVRKITETTEIIS